MRTHQYCCNSAPGSMDGWCAPQSSQPQLCRVMQTETSLYAPTRHGQNRFILLSARSAGATVARAA